MPGSCSLRSRRGCRLAVAFVTSRHADDCSPCPLSGRLHPTSPSLPGWLPGLAQSLHGKWVVLYFYPKDMTTGCTIEAHKFQATFPSSRQRRGDSGGQR